MKVIICGYKGKMGSLIHKKLVNIKTFEIIGLVDKNTKPLSELIKKKPDVVIDFTNAETCFNHALICLKNNINFLSGATGLKTNEIKYLNKLAKERELSFIISSNFSIGVNALYKSLPYISRCFNDILIEEHHHISKLDAPSGTALELKKKLGIKDIKITSYRSEEGQIYHQITFRNKNEIITIKHQTLSRSTYVDGVIYCLSKIGTFKGLKQTINF